MPLPYAFYCALILMMPIIVGAQHVVAEEEASINSSVEARGTPWPVQTSSESLSDSLFNAIATVLPTSQATSEITEGRKKKYKLKKFRKYLLPMIVGVLLIKSVLLPIALKSLAVLSGKAVVLSAMSLILAAIVGLRRASLDGNRRQDYEASHGGYPKYKRKEDDYEIVDEPYVYYKERLRRK